MKKIKIDIQKEEVETEAPYLNVEELSGFGEARIMKEGEMPRMDLVQGKRITYYGMQVYHPETKERINYFVRTDDRALFDDLIHVSDGFINQKIQNAVERALYEERTRLSEAIDKWAEAGFEHDWFNQDTWWFKLKRWFCWNWKHYFIGWHDEDEVASGIKSYINLWDEEEEQYEHR